MKPYFYKASVVRVIDGDSVEVTIDLGFKIYKRDVVRLEGIDTPELNSKDEEAREKAQAAKERLEQLLPVGATVFLDSRRLEKYGRILGAIYIGEEPTVSVGEVLLIEGHAVPYPAKS